MSRNPTWSHDELILALDLYLRVGQVDDTHPEVVELSAVLNALPIHTNRPDAEKFRNPNGVAMKLGNFRALDPNDPAAGLDAGGRRDGEVWDHFAGDPETVARLAATIRAGAIGELTFPSQPEEGEDEVAEGRLLYRQHRTRERDDAIVRKKKRKVMEATGTLACEVCGFDFAETYGDWGAGYIECHHIVPLSESGETTTKLSDLALVCSNCHRVAHRRKPWPSLDDLRATVSASGQP